MALRGLGLCIHTLIYCYYSNEILSRINRQWGMIRIDISTGGRGRSDNQVHTPTRARSMNQSSAASVLTGSTGIEYQRRLDVTRRDQDSGFAGAKLPSCGLSCTMISSPKILKSQESIAKMYHYSNIKSPKPYPEGNMQVG